ncbi:MAG: MerR family transcriptional regulator [Actinomycetota bacterium]|jgi:DNA-binding transcriptional MerR regulator|nr:MerR family transcriptional regulator [Actinomycetota bacterium]
MTQNNIDTSFGFRSPQVCSVVGITYRQLDYWDRSGLLGPSLQEATGSGTQRLYTFQDIVTLRVVKRLKDAGTSLHKIRAAFDYLELEVGEGWRESDITLLSDGTSIYAATSPEEVMDLLRKGQGVFGIAVRPVHDEVAGEIHKLFPDHAADLVANTEIAKAAGN